MAGANNPEIHVYMTPALYKRVKAAAKEDRRSLTTFIVMALEEKLARVPKGKQAA